jgi:hypothetical protein
MTDKEIIEMLMKEVESTGYTCMTMVSYVQGIWRQRMQECSDSCTETLKTAKEHMSQKDKEN